LQTGFSLDVGCTAALHFPRGKGRIVIEEESAAGFYGRSTTLQKAYCLRMGRNRGSEALLSCRIAVTMCNRICGFRLICKDYFMKSESIYKQMK